jgi:hypothetical protein
LFSVVWIKRQIEARCDDISLLPVLPLLMRRRDHEFKASLCNTRPPSQIKKKKKRERERDRDRRQEKKERLIGFYQLHALNQE